MWRGGTNWRSTLSISAVCRSRTSLAQVSLQHSCCLRLENGGLRPNTKLEQMTPCSTISLRVYLAGIPSAFAIMKLLEHGAECFSAPIEEMHAQGSFLRDACDTRTFQLGTKQRIAENPPLLLCGLNFHRCPNCQRDPQATQMTRNQLSSVPLFWQLGHVGKGPDVDIC